MNILQVTEFFTPIAGGSAQVVYQVSRHLTQRGHEVTVCTSDFRQNEIQFPDSSFGIVRFSSLPTRWKFYITPGIITWARKHLGEYDIIHMHNVRTFQNAIIANQARKIGIPYILSAHGSLPHLIGHQVVKQATDLLFAKQLVGNASRLIAVSKQEVEQYLDVGIQKEKVRIIHNGLDLDDFSFIPEWGTFRHRYDISDATKVILFLGRLHRIKGIDHLIEAFSKLKSQISEAVLVISGPDDGELDALHRLVTRYGLSEQVIFPGPLFGREKLAAYRDADVLASPGMYEIFGLVPFEALLCGTPVIVTDDCGSGQIIKDAEAGYSVTYGDAEALNASLLHILTNPQEAKLKVTRGQIYIREFLDWKQIITKIISLYQECIRESTPVQG